MVEPKNMFIVALSARDITLVIVTPNRFVNVPSHGDTRNGRRNSLRLVDSASNAGTTLPSARRTFLNGALSFAASVSLLSGLIPMTAAAATEKGAGPAIVNIVTFTVPPAGMARFLRISKENSRISRKEETGCVGFEVLLPEDEPNKVMLIETYRDEAAYKAHRVTPHFLAFVKGAQEIGVKRSARVASRYCRSRCGSTPARALGAAARHDMPFHDTIVRNSQ
jgi:quinol monooxygenase YgiN